MVTELPLTIRAHKMPNLTSERGAATSAAHLITGLRNAAPAKRQPSRSDCSMQADAVAPFFASAPGRPLALRNVANCYERERQQIRAVMPRVPS